MSNRPTQLKTSRRKSKIKKVNGTPRKALCRGYRGSDHGKTIVALWMNICYAYYICKMNFKSVNKKMDNTAFTIWMAGFYEGEGYVSNDISNNNRIRLGIDQNDPTPLVKAQKIWGGSVRARTRKSPASNKICHSNTWRLCHKDALKFIEDINPYLQIPYKIKQIEIAIAKSKLDLKRRFGCKFCSNDYASPAGRRRHEKKVHPAQALVSSEARCLEAGNP